MISLIVAVSENNVIGRSNDLPWHLPDDLKYFKKTTAGCPVIMGRKNFESIRNYLGHPLPQRHNIIVSRQADYKAEGADVVSTLEEAIALAKTDDSKEIFIIGGGQIYQAALEAGVIEKMYITRIHAEVEGDVFFPEVDLSNWSLVAQDFHAADEEHAETFTFEVYERN